MTNQKGKRFSIEGIIRGEQSGKGLVGLKVRALDKDAGTDDVLGIVNTDADGRFSINYNESDFDAKSDTLPDLYLQVENEKGQIVYTTEAKVRFGATWAEKFELQLPDKATAEIDRDFLREDFKKLITINPNYFGKLPELNLDFPVIKPKKSDTSYEELECIGLYPEKDELEAIFEIKRSSGYGGPLCSDGSTEYVAFYIDYGDGFVPAGPPAQVQVHNLQTAGKQDLSYAVRQGFDPETREKCSKAGLVRLRAILSWNRVPTGPNFVPVWGNIKEALIQIKPYSFLLSNLNFNPGLKDDLVLAGPQLEVAKLVLDSHKAVELIKKENPTDLEDERLYFSDFLEKNPNHFGAISTAKSVDQFLGDLGKWPESVLGSFDAGSLLEKFKPVKVIKPQTKFEEMTCLGLYPEDDLLEATIEIRRPSGYNGGLCTLGSKEYVAFYIDWGDGTGFVYEGSSSVRVHDDVANAKQPVMYALNLRLKDVAKRLEKCSRENVVRVRAIMSWNQDPSAFGPNYSPTWGNVLDRLIQIRPFVAEKPKPRLELISGIPVASIGAFGPSKGLAVKVNAGGHDVIGTHDRAFGGIVSAVGHVNEVGASFYRFRYRKTGTSNWINILDSRNAIGLGGFGFITRTPDAEGWFSIPEFLADKARYSPQVLLMWNSRAVAEGSYDLQMQLGNSSKVASSDSSEACVVIDNTRPELYGFTNSPLPNTGITVKKSSGQYAPCDKFSGPEDIAVFGNFADDHFKAYGLKLFGGDIPSQGVSVNSGRYDDANPAINDRGIVGASNPGSGRKLFTLNLCEHATVACAYGLKMSLSDRTIVGYTSGGYRFRITNYHVEAFVTFNWEPTGCP